MLLRSRQANALVLAAIAVLWAGIIQAQNTAPVPTTFSIIQPADGNERDAGPQKSHYALETNAYTRNIFHDITGKYASFKPSGQWHETYDEARSTLEEVKAIEHSMGEVADDSPLTDAKNHDFSPSEGSSVANKAISAIVTP